MCVSGLIAHSPITTRIRVSRRVPLAEKESLRDENPVETAVRWVRVCALFINARLIYSGKSNPPMVPDLHFIHASSPRQTSLSHTPVSRMLFRSRAFIAHVTPSRAASGSFSPAVNCPALASTSREHVVVVVVVRR